jgi:hypothetical protein
MLASRLSPLVVVASLAPVACVSSGGEGSSFGGGETETSDDEGDQSPPGSDDSGAGEDENDDDDGDDDQGEPKFDVPPPDMPEESGCKNIDFLFVVDNSQSMSDDQQRLANSFPGFIDAIEEDLELEDFHIMVVDSDMNEWESADWECQDGDCTCGPADQCCPAICDQVDQFETVDVCEGIACDDWELATGCEFELGGGRTRDREGLQCPLEGQDRYMTATQPDLTETFECLALVGEYGAPSERPMESMVNAVSTLAAPGECNDGFVRDDAILVVTFITDEEDVAKSVGDPVSWKQSLVGVKQQNEDAVVILGLLNDGDQQGVCEKENEGAPRLREFADSFEYGQWGSVCADDYAPFFLEAVSEVIEACNEFDPAG